LERQLEAERATEQTLRQQLLAEQTRRVEAENRFSQAEGQRIALEQRLTQIEQQQQAELFNDSEFQRTASAISSDAGTIGRLLLSATHPTGTYHQTGNPMVTLSDDRSAVVVQLGVTWKGVFNENPYTTVYRFRLGKLGVQRLEVVRDEAIAPIEPEYLRQAESRLNQFFASSTPG
jgi:hypothetical protein